MQTRPSGKKLIAAFGIAAGAGIALTYIYQGINRKGRILHPAKTGQRQLPATLVSSRNSLPIYFANSASPPLRTQETPAPPPRDLQIPAPSAPVRQPVILEVVALSRAQRVAAAGLDVMVVLFAFCVFLAILQIFGVGLRLRQFDISVQAFAVFLIAMLYVFLFKLGGRGTAGQAWLKLRLQRGSIDFTLQTAAWIPNAK